MCSRRYISSQQKLVNTYSMMPGAFVPEFWFEAHCGYSLGKSRSGLTNSELTSKRRNKSERTDHSGVQPLVSNHESQGCHDSQYRPRSCTLGSLNQQESKLDIGAANGQIISIYSNQFATLPKLDSDRELLGPENVYPDSGQKKLRLIGS
ncbi:hypothetical protein VNO77_05140 [Canavalia gladiata]|uniref:Uncharacterized protein n=1 Tax=Canavalia gladiata TaxID=3824 RepID=A0AAN9MYE3_CANGL